jgi:hypothetical protein
MEKLMRWVETACGWFLRFSLESSSIALVYLGVYCDKWVVGGTVDVTGSDVVQVFCVWHQNKVAVSKQPSNKKIFQAVPPDYWCGCKGFARLSGELYALSDHTVRQDRT